MKNKRLGLYIRLNENEKETVDKLKSEYSINISQMVKNHLMGKFKQLENEKNK